MASRQWSNEKLPVDVKSESPSPASPLPPPVRIKRHKRPTEPEAYCLVHERLPPSQPAEQYSPERINFRFRSRYVTASGRLADHRNPRLLLITLERSAVQEIIAGIAGALPVSVAAYIKRLFPEWFLPSDMILKKQRPTTSSSSSFEVVEPAVSNEYFETELKAYRRLQALQGIAVPALLGQVTISGQRSILLQNVGGFSLAELRGALLDLDQLAQMLEACLGSIAALGVLHGDAHPGNYRLVQDRLFAFDFEMSMFDFSKEDADFSITDYIADVGERYQEIRKTLWFDGLAAAP